MPPLLVLWDIDYTLVAAGPSGQRLYEMVLEASYGLPMPPNLSSMAGRTDTSIALEVLAAAGLTDPAGELAAFHAALAASAPEVESLVREKGRVLPGALTALESLAGIGRAEPAGPLVQSVLTGNIPALARVKLAALGLAGYLDLSIGAYGDVSANRADLVPVARRKAAARYGTAFDGPLTVLVGDTPSDVAAAIASGARSVAVATGRFSAAELAQAGADVVFADLADTATVISAVLGVATAAADAVD